MSNFDNVSKTKFNNYQVKNILSDAEDIVSKEMNNNYLMLNKKHLEAMKLDQQQHILDFKHEGLNKIATADQSLITGCKKTLGKATFTKSSKAASKGMNVALKGNLDEGKTQK